MSAQTVGVQGSGWGWLGCVWAWGCAGLMCHVMELSSDRVNPTTLSQGGQEEQEALGGDAV